VIPPPQASDDGTVAALRELSKSARRFDIFVAISSSMPWSKFVFQTSTCLSLPPEAKYAPFRENLPA